LKSLNLILITLSIFTIAGCGDVQQAVPEALLVSLISPEAGDPETRAATSFDFGTVTAGDAVVQRIYLINRSDSEISGLEVTLPSDTPFSFTGNAYPGTGGSCASTISSHGSCSVEIQLQTSTIGPVSTQMTLGFGQWLVRQTQLVNLIGSVESGIEIGTGSLTFTKLTVSDAILRAPDPMSTDCGKWLIGFTGGWRPTTFMFNGQVRFYIPCKYDDSFWDGWHGRFAAWDRVAASVTWEAAPYSLSKFGTTNDGYNTNNDLKTVSFVENGIGQLVGLGTIRAGWNQFPIFSTSIATMTVADFDTLQTNNFPTTSDRDILYDGGTYYYYSGDGGGTTVTLSTTADMRNPAAADVVLSNHFNRPYVFKQSAGIYHMIAFNTTSQHWEHIRGTSPSDWDFDNSTDLNLRSYQGSPGAWDYNYFQNIGGQNEPMVVGVEMVGSTVYLFYFAGDYGYPGATPYGAPRGIGVLTSPAP